MNSFIPWIGGKKLLRKEIVKRFPEKMDRYVEVFGGAGWVLFYREKYAKEEVYNDINGELVNLFRCVKYHAEALAEELKFMLNSREMFLMYRDMDTSVGMTEIQRAARFYYLVRASYGAKLDSYGGNYRDVSLLKDMEQLKERLARVVIENRNFADVIKRYDKEHTLFYCDPPYHKTEHFYDMGGTVFDEKQHILLRDTLAGIQGKFVLSYNNDEFVRELYQDFCMEEVERSNNLGVILGKQKVYKELLIRNY